ncbi:hypothetical protein CBW42_10850 [Butyricicoccus porcorum]|uniref:Uncharacterized protein n=1 Tax=Butyricicoccus porcorum TaxID=1945634 RepID=A0A252F2D7_9FIRM|nr:hypothetical protein CBW42_10850 [Butyricicoccus porcorum]
MRITFLCMKHRPEAHIASEAGTANRLSGGLTGKALLHASAVQYLSKKIGFKSIRTPQKSSIRRPNIKNFIIVYHTFAQLYTHLCIFHRKTGTKNFCFARLFSTLAWFSQFVSGFFAQFCNLFCFFPPHAVY